MQVRKVVDNGPLLWIKVWAYTGRVESIDNSPLSQDRLTPLGMPGLRPGRKSDLDTYLHAQCAPRWRESLTGKARQIVEQRIEKLNKLPQAVLAVRLLVESHILATADSRAQFARLVREGNDKEARILQLNDQLDKRPGAPDWWLVELVYRFSVSDEQERGRELDRVAGIGRAEPHTLPCGWPEVPAASQQEIEAVVMLSSTTERVDDQLARAQQEAAALQRRIDEDRQTITALQDQLGREAAERATAQAMSAAAGQTVETLRQGLGSSERERDRERDRAVRAEARAAEQCEVVAQALAYLEATGSSDAAETAGDGKPLLEAARLPVAAIRLRRRLNHAAPPTHRALAVYLAAHGDLAGKTSMAIAEAAGTHRDLVERLLTAQHLPGRDTTTAIARALGADAHHTSTLYAAAAQNNYTALVDECFNALVQDLETDNPPASESLGGKQNTESEPLTPSAAGRTAAVRSLAMTVGQTVAGVVGILLVIGLLGGLICGSFALADAGVSYASGTTPTALAMDPVYCGYEGACSTSQTYTVEWEHVATGLSTTLQPEISWLGSVGHARGELDLTLPHGCNAAVAWSMKADGTPLASGALNGTADTSTELNAALPNRHPKTITVTADWLAGHSCSNFTLTWSDAELTSADAR
jgi:hypothetical protein